MARSLDILASEVVRTMQLLGAVDAAEPAERGGAAPLVPDGAGWSRRLLEVR